MRVQLGLCVQSPLHGLEQQLGTLLQQGQGLPPVAGRLARRDGLRHGVQLGLDRQQRLGEDASHLLVIVAGLLEHLVFIKGKTCEKQAWRRDGQEGRQTDKTDCLSVCV